MDDVNSFKGWIGEKRTFFGDWLSAEEELCPRCGSRLVERTGGNKPDTGYKYVGCSKFPHCTYAKAAKITFVKE